MQQRFIDMPGGVGLIPLFGGPLRALQVHVQFYGLFALGGLALLLAETRGARGNHQQQRQKEAGGLALGDGSHR
jgi:hypothetical protein